MLLVTCYLLLVVDGLDVSRSLLVVHVLKEFVQSVLESINGGRLHGVRRKTIPVVNNSLGEKVLPQVQSTWLFA